MKVKNGPQMSNRSSDLDDLNEEDWPYQDSFKVDSDYLNLTIGSSRATESERETMLSSSSSILSRRSSIFRALLKKPEAENRELTQQIAEMKKTAGEVLKQKWAECATIPMHHQEPNYQTTTKSARTDDSTYKRYCGKHNNFEQYNPGHS